MAVHRSASGAHIAAMAALLLAPFASGAQAAEIENCLWLGPVPTAQRNGGFPDTGGFYWYAEYQTPPGAKLVLRGAFPHARHMSVTSYDDSGKPTDGTNDVDLVPDAGSTNPFVPGASRTARDRSFTIELLNEVAPAQGRRANTLYAGTGAQKTQKLLYRVFVPDQGRDATGEGGLPQHQLRLADGTTLSGQAACEAIKANPERKIALLNLKLPAAAYLARRAPVPDLPSTHPATNPLVWEGFFGSPYFATAYLRGTPRESERAKAPVAKAGGGYSNKDVDFIFAFADRQFGDVLVLRGKAPTTPRTSGGAAVMTEGQVRYWSLCNNESAATTKVVACVYDEQVPLNADNDYVIAVSTQKDQPANAVPRCGVTWLDAGTTGDGVDRPTANLLMMRNLLPAPSFAQAFQNVRTPGTESQVLGPYLPKGTYMSRQQFESLGCPVR